MLLLLLSARDVAMLLLSQLLGAAVAAVAGLARDASAVALRDASAVTLRTSQATSVAQSDPAGDWLKDLGNRIVTVAENCGDIANFNVGRCVKNGVQPFVRDTKMFGAVTKINGDKSWKLFQAGLAFTSDYVEQRLQSDLVWLGQQIGDAICKNDIGRSVAITSCAVGLSAAVCAATDGLGPGCLQGDTLQKGIQAIGLAAIQNGFQCAAFATIRSLPQAPCDGVSWSIATAISSFLVSDPYTPICDAIIKCSCGAGSTCPFTCDNPLVPATTAICDFGVNMQSKNTQPLGRSQSLVDFGKLSATVVEQTCGQTYGDLETAGWGDRQAYTRWDELTPLYPRGYAWYSVHKCNNDANVLILTSRRDMKPYATFNWWRVNKLAPGVSVTNYNGGIAYKTSNFHVRPETYTAPNGAKVWNGLCPCGDQGMTLVSLTGSINPPTVPPPTTPRPTKQPTTPTIPTKAPTLGICVYGVCF